MWWIFDNQVTEIEWEDVVRLVHLAVAVDCDDETCAGDVLYLQFEDGSEGTLLT